MVEHNRVKGRVQGVGFRWFVQREPGRIHPDFLALIYECRHLHH